MRRALQGFNVLWEMENLPQIKMRIGVHYGDVIVELWNLAEMTTGFWARQSTRQIASKSGATPMKSGLRIVHGP